MKIRNVETNYIQYGKDKGKNIIFLHGWGQNIEMMKPLADNFFKDYKVTILDFPGFGKSQEPEYDWNLSDYCEFLEEFINKLKIKNPILVGHSFGGRVALKYSSFHNVKKIVLFGAPCFVKNKDKDLKTKVLKKLKKMPGMSEFGEFMKNYIGSTDYKSASPRMRQILVNVVNEDLSNCAKKIEAPTLLIWGENDEQVPINEAQELEKIMPDAALIRLPGTHYAYLENLQVVTNILYNFFGG